MSSNQIKQMYIALHTHLKRYEYERICHLGACSSAYNLSLNLVSHFWELDFFKAKEALLKPIFSKKLKNNIVKNLKELILLINSGFTIDNYIA